MLTDNGKINVRDVHLAFREVFLVNGSPPEVTGAEIAVAKTFSENLQGNFLEFISHSDSCFDVIIGDVVASAADSAEIGLAFKYSFRKAIEESLKLTECSIPGLETPAIKAWRGLSERVKEAGGVVACCFSRFDTEARTCSIINFGYTGTLHYSAKRAKCSIIESTASPLGVQSPLPAQVRCLEFDENDVFLFYSDGISGALNDAGESFGTRGLKELLKRFGKSSPKAITEAVLNSTSTFAAREVFSDDMLCTAVKSERRDG